MRGEAGSFWDEMPKAGNCVRLVSGTVSGHQLAIRRLILVEAMKDAVLGIVVGHRFEVGSMICPGQDIADMSSSMVWTCPAARRRPAEWLTNNPGHQSLCIRSPRIEHGAHGRQLVADERRMRWIAGFFMFFKTRWGKAGFMKRDKTKDARGGFNRPRRRILRDWSECGSASPANPSFARNRVPGSRFPRGG